MLLSANRILDCSTHGSINSVEILPVPLWKGMENKFCNSLKTRTGLLICKLAEIKCFTQKRHMKSCIESREAKKLFSSPHKTPLGSESRFSSGFWWKTSGWNGDGSTWDKIKSHGSHLLSLERTNITPFHAIFEEMGLISPRAGSCEWEILLQLRIIELSQCTQKAVQKLVYFFYCGWWQSSAKWGLERRKSDAIEMESNSSQIRSCIFSFHNMRTREQSTEKMKLKSCSILSKSS